VTVPTTDRSVFTTERFTDLIGQSKFGYGALLSGSSQFTLLPQLPQKMTLNLKVANTNLKAIILLHYSKTVSHSV